MRFSVNIPNFGDFADAHTVARTAVAAEQAGWDGLLLWDHVVHDKKERRGKPFGDPWMLLTAAALATSRIKVGTLVAAVPRYRPEQLARQVATLDALSGGRVVFGAGLGGPVDDEYGDFGDTVDRVVHAERLDEGLDLLARYWSGGTVDHDGAHFRVKETQLLPATAQQPRPPVWIGGFWPARPPMRRAARWDGAAPLFADALHGVPPRPDQFADVVRYVNEHRESTEGPFDFVVGGLTPPGKAAALDVVGPLADAGATWWDERQLQTGGTIDSYEAVLRRIEAGPPVL
ncbi:LLM class flavin-dependent oxidoreductase [Streptomyces sp. NPDC102384]|uniref:LLM class flavin-dependent oxidoreductase n=1 Tax=Streptomyces sp. NPDC102384 TaxID=3366166 RepID=UPI0038213494